MILWTIQHRAVLATLEQEGVLRGDWRRVEADMLPAYRWMAEQLRRQGITRELVCPIWAWNAWEGSRCPVPDVHRSGHLPKGTPGVRIEIDVEPGTVLLSRFDHWNAVLNQRYLSLSEGEEREVLQAVGAGQVNAGEVQRSWDRVFELDSGTLDWCGTEEGRSIQAAMPALYGKDVRSVTPFVAR